MDRNEIESRIGTYVGAWKLEELLGVGGMAAVYRCTGPSGAQGAAKVLHTSYSEHASIRRRFAREMTILNLVDHRSAVSVLDPGDPANPTFYVMELLDGVTLDELWRRHRGRVPEQTLVPLIAQLLDVLEAYHEHGVIHRDLKPANIFVTFDGVLKLLDFGVARFRREADDPRGFTRDGTTVGTPSFMAPEQAQGRVSELSARSDMFSVGAVMYTCVTGIMMHDAGSSDRRLALAASTPAPSVTRSANIDAQLAQIIDCARSWQPRDRFASAAKMASMLHTYASENLTIVPARPAGPVEVMRAFFGSLERLVESCHEGSRDTIRLGVEATRRLNHATRLDPAIMCSIEPGWVMMYGEEVWRPDHLSILPRMHQAGFRALKFTTGAFEHDIERLAMFMARKKADLPPEDGLISAFADLDLSCIRGVMERASVRADGALFRRIKSQLWRRQPAPATPAFRSQFKEALGALSDDGQKDAWIVGHLWNDAREHGDTAALRDAIESIVPSRLEEHRFEDLIQFIERSARLVPAADRSTYFAHVFAGSNVARIARHALRPDVRLNTNAARRLRGFLAFAPSDAASETLDELRVLPPALRLFELFFAAHLAGCSEALVGLARDGNSRTLAALLAIASHSECTREAGILAAEVLKSDDERLQHAAMRLFESRLSDEFAPHFEMVLTYGTAELRASALRVVCQQRMASAAQVIAALVQMIDFDSRPLSERELMLDALFLIDRSNAELTCIRLLDETRAVDSTRLMLRALGNNADSIEARSALDRYQRRRDIDSSLQGDAFRALGDYDRRMELS